jgi:hypothetical protein
MTELTAAWGEWLEGTTGHTPRHSPLDNLARGRQHDAQYSGTSAT